MKIIWLIISIFLVGSPTVVFAENVKGNISLSINPLLEKINIAPGETWSGSVEVFNSNFKDLRFAIFVQDFRGGEEGNVQFIDRAEIEKNIDEGKEFLLSQWVEISREPLLIPARDSKVVPFTISIPENAGPGGKYAAILAAIKPDEDLLTGTSLAISPSVGSLILLNVRGNVVESAFVREFSTERNMYINPEVPFFLRIQNDGNTHVQPRGDIKIYNQTGSIVETILVNYDTQFGNILPQSSRSWSFLWDGDSFFQMGRYRAVLTLVYGEEASQTITKTLYFWIIPIGFIVGLLVFVLSLPFIIFLMEYFEKTKKRQAKV